MAHDFLLDTNVLRALFDETDVRHAKTKARLEALSKGELEPKLFISAITIGELNYGNNVNPGQTRNVDDYAAFIERRCQVIDVGRHTATSYGEMRASLFNKYGPKKKKGLRAEQLRDPLTSQSLGIQENDLWLAAQALERDLTFISDDRMEHIVACAEDLRLENWGR